MTVTEIISIYNSFDAQKHSLLKATKDIIKVCSYKTWKILCFIVKDVNNENDFAVLTNFVNESIFKNQILLEQKRLLLIWSNKRDKSTLYHRKKLEEKESIKNENINKKYNIFNLEIGNYKEFSIFYGSLNGRVDEMNVFLLDGKKTVDIIDYKFTNSNINVYYSKIESLYSLPSSKYNLYSLQLSLYAWIMAMNGYQVRNLIIVQVIESENKIVEHKIKAKYLKEEVKIIINKHIK